MIKLRIALLAVTAGALMLAVTACAPKNTNADHSTPVPTSVDNLDASTLAYLKSNAAALAKQLNIADPPIVEPIRLIPLDEWGPTQIACLNKAGFNASETSDGQGVEYPPYQDPALIASLNMAIYTCEVQYPTQQKYMTPLSAKGLKMLYVYRTGELVRCLTKEGYSISTRPPSESVFVQNYGKWSPYGGLAVSPNDQKRVFKACPETPESVYGN